LIVAFPALDFRSPSLPAPAPFEAFEAGFASDISDTLRDISDSPSDDEDEEDDADATGAAAAEPSGSSELDDAEADITQQQTQNELKEAQAPSLFFASPSSRSPFFGGDSK
jgi:hypothetical protein